MAGLIIFLSLFLSLGSDSFAQTYRYVDKKGTVCFTDNPPASLLKNDGENQEPQKPIAAAKPLTPTRKEIKDILQIGQEALAEELAKPPGKQNRALIREMTEILYGKVSGKKPK